MATIYQMVNYLRFDDVGVGSLESLCRAALDQADPKGVKLWERAHDRAFDLGDEFGGQILLNRGADLRSAVFGEMCLVEARGLQALLEMEPSKVQMSDLTLAEIYQLDERQAPTGSRFLRGLVYWMALGNHLFFLKTQAMTAERLRAYLDWLLKVRTTTLPGGFQMNLRSEFDVSAAAGDIGDIRRLRISGNSPPRTVEPAAEAVKATVSTRRKIAERQFVTTQAEDLARVILGPARTQSLIETLGPDEYLSADATLAVKGRRTPQSKEKLRQLVDNLADETDAKVQIEGKDGRITEGDAILRTRMPFNVPHDGSNLLDFDNVADQLREVYSRFVRDGKIKA